eukprot:12912959-Prorocentrum_lima.AAC.1
MRIEIARIEGAPFGTLPAQKTPAPRWPLACRLRWGLTPVTSDDPERLASLRSADALPPQP